MVVKVAEALYMSHVRMYSFYSVICVLGLYSLSSTPSGEASTDAHKTSLAKTKKHGNACVVCT